MNLIPLTGIDEIRFGDSIDCLIQKAGNPKERREHSDPINSFSLTYDSMSFGFDESQVLNFIVIDDGPTIVDLWGANPFEIAKSCPDPLKAIRDWLVSLDRGHKVFSDSFCGSISVPDQGVTFCFPLPDWDCLEGVQLYLPFETM